MPQPAVKMPAPVKSSRAVALVNTWARARRKQNSAATTNRPIHISPATIGSAHRAKVVAAAGSVTRTVATSTVVFTGAPLGPSGSAHGLRVERDAHRNVVAGSHLQQAGHGGHDRTDDANRGGAGCDVKPQTIGLVYFCVARHVSLLFSPMDISVIVVIAKRYVSMIVVSSASRISQDPPAKSRCRKISGR